MAIVTKEQLLERLKKKMGDDTSDEALALIEDVSDTCDDLSSKANGGGEDWKKKYEECDAAWRKKYRDRFYSGKDDDKGGKDDHKDGDGDKGDKDDGDKPLTYDNLFKEETK